MYHPKSKEKNGEKETHALYGSCINMVQKGEAMKGRRKEAPIAEERQQKVTKDMRLVLRMHRLTALQEELGPRTVQLGARYRRMDGVLRTPHWLKGCRNDGNSNSKRLMTKVKAACFYAAGTKTGAFVMRGAKVQSATSASALAARCCSVRAARRASQALSRSSNDPFCCRPPPSSPPGPT